MKDPIFDVAFWKDRLDKAEQLHHAIFRCPLEKWQAIEKRHRKILDDVIVDTDSILDAGCGWGRLLELLPKDHRGVYTGVDLSPDFLDLALRRHPNQVFKIGDLRNLSAIREDLRFSGGNFQYDWAILISIKPMVIRNEGQEIWDVMEAELRLTANRVLLLEYDENDEGEILQ